MKFLFLPVIILSALIGQAQHITADQVPAPVSKSIATAYPTATELKWEKKKDSYKAGFKIGKKDHDVWLAADGSTIKHRFEIKKDELPPAVQETIKKDFSTYTIDDCEKTNEKGTSTYKVELKSEAGKKNVRLGADGKVIPKKEDD